MKRLAFFGLVLLAVGVTLAQTPPTSKYPAPAPVTIEATSISLDRIKLGRLQLPDAPTGAARYDYGLAFIDPSNGSWWLRGDGPRSIAGVGIRRADGVDGKWYLCTCLAPVERIGVMEWFPETADVQRLHGLTIRATTVVQPGWP